VSEATISGAKATVEVREIDRLVVFGQTHPQAVFEILGRKGTLTPTQLAVCDHYAQGLAAYRAQHWDEARTAFKAALGIAAGDGPCLTLLKRIDAFERKPPPADWDGSWRMEHK
jgi:hypothetical protein